MADWKSLAKQPIDVLQKVKYNDPRLDAFTSVVEDRYGLPRDLLLAVKNAGERSNTTQVSKKGAKGVMQFIDATRKIYPHDWRDPFASIDAAGRYFVDLMKMSKGDPKAAIAQYNGGTKSRQAVMRGEEIPFEETRKYWSRIQGYMEDRYNQGLYNPVPKNTEPQPQQQVAQNTVEQPSPEQTAMP
jgi:soluble lytic murein transglycosylase-like protein